MPWLLITLAAHGGGGIYLRVGGLPETYLPEGGCHRQSVWGGTWLCNWQQLRMSRTQILWEDASQQKRRNLSQVHPLAFLPKFLIRESTPRPHPHPQGRASDRQRLSNSVIPAESLHLVEIPGEKSYSPPFKSRLKLGYSFSLAPGDRTRLRARLHIGL